MESEYAFFLSRSSLTFTFIESVDARTEEALAEPRVDSIALMTAQQCKCVHKIVGVGDQVVVLGMKHRHARCPPIRLDVNVADIQPHPIKNKFGRAVLKIVTNVFD